jgi:hypothetical protein
MDRLRNTAIVIGFKLSNSFHFANKIFDLDGLLPNSVGDPDPDLFVRVKISGSGSDPPKMLSAGTYKNLLIRIRLK